MFALGIEGTAHTFGVGIVKKNAKGGCDVLANEMKAFTTESGGIHPREAANHHASVASVVISDALKKANLSASEIDVICFSQGPGLGPCLRTAATAARTLALRFDKPIMGVNHCVAHLEIGRGTIDECRDPVLLYTSGANTQVIGFTNGRYRVFGETLDIGIGNCLDKFGRQIGMGFPFGPKLEHLAKKGSVYHPLPYSIKGMDLAFSGLLTAAVRLFEQGAALEDVCFSIQETTFAMLTEVTERAMAHTQKNQVLLGGGVASNARLREMVELMASQRGAESFVPQRSLCVDNGAMIAWLGLVMFESGIRMSLEQSVVNQRFRTDMVEVSWRG